MAISLGASASHSLEATFDELVDNPGAMSIAMWVRVNAAPDASNYLVHKYDGGSQTGWLLMTKADRTLQWFTEIAAASETSDAGAALAAATWQHVVVSWDGSDVEFYIDAVDSAGASGHTKAAGTSSGFGITLGNSGGAGAPVSMAHVMVWDTALTANEAVSLFAGGLVQTDNLKFWYSGDVLDGYNQMTGVAASVTGSPTIVEGAPHSGSPRPGAPREQLFLDAPPLNRQYVFLEPGPFVGTLNGITRPHVTIGEQPRDPRMEECVTSTGTTSETVTIPAPGSITTTWTKGYTSITTCWNKGRNSYA